MTKPPQSFQGFIGQRRVVRLWGRRFRPRGSDFRAGGKGVGTSTAWDCVVRVNEVQRMALYT